jgi:hypothetical protein
MLVTCKAVRLLAWTAVPVLALGGLVLTGASAQPAGKAKPEAQAVSNHQLVEAMHVLVATKKTLEAADHDYGGHRADAVKAIGAAHHQLKLALEFIHKGKAEGGGKPGGAGKPAGNSEPQKISDMQLAEAIPILKATTRMLQKADHDYGGHRADAVRDLEGAIKELETALAFVRKQGK